MSARANHLAAMARLSAYEYENAAQAWVNAASPREMAGGQHRLVHQARMQAVALREIADIIEGLGRLDAALQLSLGVDVLAREVGDG